MNFNINDTVKPKGDWTPRANRTGRVLAEKNGIYTVRLTDGIVNLYSASEIEAA